MSKTKDKWGRPPIFKNKEDLEVKINAYFDMCDKNDKPYTVTGLALALECDRHTILNYEHKNKEYFSVIKKAKDRIIDQVEGYLFSKKQVAGSIFWLKANQGWQDKIILAGDASNPIELHIVNFAKATKNDQ